MSVNQFLNGKLNLIAGAGGGNCDCDSKIFTGTAAEYEAQKDTIEDGTIINIIDDTLDGELLSTNVLNRVSDLEEDVEELKNNSAGASNIVYLTQAEYDALPESKLTDDVEYRITDEGVEGTARNLSYDNTDSGIEAVNVQDAIDKLNDSLGGFAPVIDETGKITGYKTKVGADTVFPFKSEKSVFDFIIDTVVDNWSLPDSVTSFSTNANSIKCVVNDNIMHYVTYNEPVSLKGRTKLILGGLISYNTGTANSKTYYAYGHVEISKDNGNTWTQVYGGKVGVGANAKSGSVSFNSIIDITEYSEYDCLFRIGAKNNRDNVGSTTATIEITTFLFY